MLVINSIVNRRRGIFGGRGRNIIISFQRSRNIRELITSKGIHLTIIVKHKRRHKDHTLFRVYVWPKERVIKPFYMTSDSIIIR
ncbi:hypothetical protein GOP47_0013190 [Adiantum capillus-veneris]|uniref:Uncharacterized protein n=1 Tax=Adiantum capillus-veneris TaxID=13818 RepID=A0A9D4UN29_ADICA|nr:hypothetical protein GOP47_0013190 [Adiantum capillus-veneris]